MVGRGVENGLNRMKKILLARPYRVVEVDDVGMLVLHLRVKVGMAMWLRPLPAFVYMLMVLVVEMGVLVLGFLVQVFQVARVVRRP